MLVVVKNKWRDNKKIHIANDKGYPLCRKVQMVGEFVKMEGDDETATCTACKNKAKYMDEKY